MAHTFLHSLAIVFSNLVKGLVLLSLWVLVGVTGFFFLVQLTSPLNIIFGFPLILISLTMGLQESYIIMISLISGRWRRTHCPFCQTSEEVEKILSPYDAFGDKELKSKRVEE